MRLFDAVLIRTGEGACACPGGSAYPHYCSLLTRVDSAEADQVGSQRFRFCAYVGCTIDEGVRHYRTTPGAFKFLLRFLLVVAYCRMRQLLHSRSPPTRRYDLLRHRRHDCHVKRPRRALLACKDGHSRWARVTSARQRLPSCITSTSFLLPWPLPLLLAWCLCPYLRCDVRCANFLPLCPVQGFKLVTGIDFGDLLVQRHRPLVIGKPRR